MIIQQAKKFFIGFSANMNIQFKPSFCSRNKNVQKADNIQRKAKNVFPSLSPTFMDTFYCSTKSTDPEVQTKSDKLITHLDKKITILRRMVDNKPSKFLNEEDRKIDAAIFRILRGVKILKTANCQECAAITIAALAANGIYNASRERLMLDLNYINKETGEIEYSAEIPIDHTSVRTQIGQDNIIIDGWMGFALSESEAIAKYKQTLLNDNIKPELSLHRSLFRLEKAEQGKLINPDTDYNLQTRLKFVKCEEASEEYMQDIGYYTRCFYPDLIL